MLLDERLGNDRCGLSPRLSIVVAICDSISQGGVYGGSWAAWRRRNWWWCDSRSLGLDQVSTRSCTRRLVWLALRSDSGLVTRLLVCFIVAHVTQVDNVYDVEIVCLLILLSNFVRQNLLQRKHPLLTLVIHGSLWDLLGHLGYLWLIQVSIDRLDHVSLRYLLHNGLVLVVGPDLILLSIGYVKRRLCGCHRLHHVRVARPLRHVLVIHLDLSPLILHPYSSASGCSTRSSQRLLCTRR